MLYAKPSSSSPPATCPPKLSSAIAPPSTPCPRSSPTSPQAESMLSRSAFCPAKLSVVLKQWYNPSMPTVLRIGRYRFFFYSNENEEPAHIHVKAGEDEAKFWLQPVGLAANHGFRVRDLT